MRRFLVGVVILGVIQTVGGGGRASAADTKQPPNLVGMWRFDPSRSDAPHAPGMHGGGGPHGGGGRPGGYPGGGSSGGPPRNGARPARLPDMLKVVEGAGYLRMEDSTGTDVLLIVTNDAKADSAISDDEAPRFDGSWKGDRLEAKHEDERGFSILQTYTVKDKGRTLEVKTKFTGGRTIEIKRVYERVTS